MAHNFAARGQWAAKLACESGLVAVLLTEIGDWDEEIFKQIKYLRARGRAGYPTGAGLFDSSILS